MVLAASSAFLIRFSAFATSSAVTSFLVSFVSSPTVLFSFEVSVPSLLKFSFAEESRSLGDTSVSNLLEEGVDLLLLFLSSWLRSLPLRLSSLNFDVLPSSPLFELETLLCSLSLLVLELRWVELELLLLLLWCRWDDDLRLIN